jgi:hypothetical protein
MAPIVIRLLYMCGNLKPGGFAGGCLQLRTGVLIQAGCMLYTATRRAFPPPAGCAAGAAVLIMNRFHHP